MARSIVKTLTVTRVSFKTVSVEDGVPCFVDQPDAVFGGQLDKDKVERQLRARLGKDTMIVITNIDAGQHRYEMTMEEFVLNAQIVDNTENEADESEDEDAQPAEMPADAGEIDSAPAAETPAEELESDFSADPVEPEACPENTSENSASVDEADNEEDVPF